MNHQDWTNIGVLESKRMWLFWPLSSAERKSSRLLVCFGLVQCEELFREMFLQTFPTVGVARPGMWMGLLFEALVLSRLSNIMTYGLFLFLVNEFVLEKKLAFRIHSWVMLGLEFRRLVLHDLFSFGNFPIQGITSKPASLKASS